MADLFMDFLTLCDSSTQYSEGLIRHFHVHNNEYAVVLTLGIFVMADRCPPCNTLKTTWFNNNLYSQDNHFNRVVRAIQPLVPQFIREAALEIVNNEIHETINGRTEGLYTYISHLQNYLNTDFENKITTIIQWVMSNLKFTCLLLDVDTNRVFATNHNIRSVPNVQVFMENKTLGFQSQNVYEHIRQLSKELLQGQLERVLKRGIKLYLLTILPLYLANQNLITLS